jgi:hypothetical protein
MCQAPVDSAPAETPTEAALDTATADTVVTEAALDTATPDTVVTEAAPDTATPDTVVTEAAPDTATPDTVITEAAADSVADSIADTGCGGSGQLCCVSIADGGALTCNNGATCNVLGGLVCP